MFEVVEDPFFFHQTRHEIESGFVVLNTVVTFLIRGFQIVAEISETEIRKDAFDDLGHALVLENTTVGGFRKQPEPRVYVREETRQPKVGLLLDKPAHNAVEMMLGVVAKVECYSHGFADNRLKVDGVIF